MRSDEIAGKNSLVVKPAGRDTRVEGASAAIADAASMFGARRKVRGGV
jgi:hypothetical protein